MTTACRLSAMPSATGSPAQPSNHALLDSLPFDLLQLADAGQLSGQKALTDQAMRQLLRSLPRAFLKAPAMATLTGLEVLDYFVLMTHEMMTIWGMLTRRSTV